MATKLNTKTATQTKAAAPTQSAAPQRKTKVADGIEQGFFQSVMDTARAQYLAIMTTEDPPSAKRVLIAYVVGFVTTCSVIYFMMPFIISLMVLAELFTGYAFLGFMAGVLGLLFAWWASAKLGGFVNDLITARVVERGALRAYDIVRNVFTPKIAVA